MHWNPPDDEDDLNDATTAATTINVCDEEKAAVRAALPSGLTDPAPRIRTAVSMAIASVAQWDWPDEWPDLMRHLIGPLEASCSSSSSSSSSSSADESVAVAGVLRCLELCAPELQEEHLTEALRSLMPLLLRFVTTTPHPLRERARAVRVVHKLLSVVVCTDEASVRRLSRGPLNGWTDAIFRMLSSSANGNGNSHDLSDCALELALLNLLRLLVSTMPRALDAHAEGLIAPIGLLLRAARF